MDKPNPAETPAPLPATLNQPGAGRRSFWSGLVVILVGLHLLAWWYAEHLIRVSLAGRADLLLDALLASAEQTLQASHYLEERIGTRLRAIAEEIASHPEVRDQASLRRIREANDLKAVMVYDPQGRLLAADDPTGLASELPPEFGCHSLLVGSQTEHTFGFTEGIFCEADAFGFARRLPEGGLVRVLTDVGFVLGFERNVGLTALVERFRRHPDVRVLALVDPAGRSLLPANLSPPSVPNPPGTMAVRTLVLHGKVVGRFELVLADHGLSTLRRTALLTLVLSMLLGCAVLGLLARRARRDEELQEERRAREDLERQSQGLANVVASVAHEIRNPLNTLSLGLESLRASLPPDVTDADQAGRLELLQGTVAEANRLVQDLLQTTRPIIAQWQDIDLPPWLEEVRLAFATGFPQTVLVPRGSPPARVRTDPLLLRRLLLNLLANAAQAGAGKVALSWEPLGTSTVVTISDNGPGLRPEVRSNLFLPGNTGRADGSGLGLYNARRLAIALGGQLDLAATGPDGTRFALVLPDSLPGEGR